MMTTNVGEKRKYLEVIVNGLTGFITKCKCSCDKILIIQLEQALNYLMKDGKPIFFWGEKELDTKFYGSDDMEVTVIYRDYFLLGEKESYICLLKTHLLSLKDLCMLARNDKDIVATAVSLSVKEFAYASDNLRKSVEYVGHLIQRYPMVLRYSDEKLLTNEDLILRVVCRAPQIIEFLPEDFKKNNEFILKVAKQNEDTLPWLSEKYVDDLEFMSLVSVDNPRVLCHASDRLRDDDDFVLSCLKSGYSFLVHIASERLLKDKEFMSKVVKLDGLCLEYASDELRSDLDVVNIALSRNREAIRFVDHLNESLRNNEEFEKILKRFQIVCSLPGVFESEVK